MGACASKFTVLKSADGAPPEPAETRDVKLEEETVKGDSAAAEPAEVEEAKRQSLGEWFKENEGADVLAKKSSSNPALVAADAPAKDDALVNDLLESKTPSQNVEAEASLLITEEKSVAEKKSDENKPDEKSSTEKKSEETKQDLISGVDKKPDAPEMEVNEETVAAKPAETTTKLEISGKIEDKPAQEALQTEKPNDQSTTDKKPATPELRHEVQKSDLDAEKEKDETNIVVSEKEPKTLEVKGTDGESSILGAEKEKTEVPIENPKPVPADNKERDETKSMQDVEKQKIEEKLTATEVPTKVVVEPQPNNEIAASGPAEESTSNKNPENTETGTEEKKPAADAEMPETDK